MLYLINSKAGCNTDLFVSIKNLTAERKPEMSYREVYFRIDSGYQGYNGWSNESEKTAFKEETRKLFLEDGWTLHEGQGAACDTVKKQQQDLYLHPMNFSGVVVVEDIPQIECLLAQAKTFRHRATDLYDVFVDMSDDEYMALLESKREEITTALLKSYKTKRRNLYITSPVAFDIARQFSIHRVCDIEGKHNKAYSFVSALVKELVADRQLITANTKEGVGIRTATARD